LNTFWICFFGFLAFCFIVGTLANQTLSSLRWGTASRLFYLYARDQITGTQLGVFINELSDIKTIKELKEMEVEIENIKNNQA